VNAWLASGSLKRAETGEDVKVDLYMSAKGVPRPDWGCRLPTTVADMPVLHGQGQSKQVAEESRQVFYLARFGLDIPGVYCSCCLQFKCLIHHTVP
jgi:hypothetical protein